jgi:hypothetical protein
VKIIEVLIYINGDYIHYIHYQYMNSKKKQKSIVSDSLKKLNDMEKIGTKTLETLKEQKEQLIESQCKIDHVDNNLSFTQRLLRRISIRSLF